MVHGVVARSARWRMGTGFAGGADAHIPVGMGDLAVSGGALPACYHAAPNGAYSQKDQGSTRPAQRAGIFPGRRRTANHGPDRNTHLSLARCASRRNCRSEEHTSELQSLMRNSYAVFCLKTKKTQDYTHTKHQQHATP